MPPNRKKESMSTDESVTEDLVETLEDGKKGYAEAAEKLEEYDPAIAATFRELSSQREQFSRELRELADNYGDHVEESGSAAAALHRGWISLRDALAGSNPDGLLAAVKQGEDHAVGKFEDASSKDISDGLRTIVQRQLSEVVTARDRVSAMLDK